MISFSIYTSTSGCPLLVHRGLNASIGTILSVVYDPVFTIFCQLPHDIYIANGFIHPSPSTPHEKTIMSDISSMYSTHLKKIVRKWQAGNGIYNLLKFDKHGRDVGRKNWPCHIFYGGFDDIFLECYEI